MTGNNDPMGTASTDWVDPDEIPDLSTPEWQEKIAAAPMVNKGGRPRAAAPKAKVNLRLPPDVLDYYRATGPGWHTRMEAALRAGMK